MMLIVSDSAVLHAVVVACINLVLRPSWDNM